MIRKDLSAVNEQTRSLQGSPEADLKEAGSEQEALQRSLHGFIIFHNTLVAPPQHTQRVRPDIYLENDWLTVKSYLPVMIAER